MRERRKAAALAALAVVATACGTDEQVGKLEEALSHPGAWDIPADVVAAGDTQYVEYTGAGAWVGESACSGSMTTGARALRDWLMASFPQISSIGGYSCRAIVGDSSQMSVHGTGRALDVMIPLHAGDADNDLGDPIGNWLIEHAEEIGIQYIIWDRWTWGAHRAAGSKERAYGGTHPHHDHLHVELSVEGGRAATPWFSGAMDPPSVDCDPLPADGGVVDETSSCFRAFGPSAYWRRVEGAGHGGSLLWTNAFESDSPSNWARWHVVPSEPGHYAVEVWAEPEYALWGATRYSVRHAGSETTLEIDQSAGTGWLRLGVFPFDAGAGQHVSVYDDSPVSVAPEQHIAADALRLVPAGAEEETPSFSSPPASWPVPVIEGGDPTLDDDPLPDDPRLERGLEGGCAAGGRPAPGPFAALALLFFCGVRRRRSERATRRPPVRRA